MPFCRFSICRYFCFSPKKGAGCACCLCCFALSVKEDAAITVCAIGLYSLIFLREVRLGIFIIAFSSIWYAVATGFVIPYFHQAPSRFLSNYRYLGENVLDIITVCLSQPGYIISLMKEHGLIVYCFVLLAPCAFSALFCPEVLCIAVPALCLNLLADPVQYVVPHSPVSWHIAPLIPCIVIAGIYGMKRVRGLLDNHTAAPSGSCFQRAPWCSNGDCIERSSVLWRNTPFPVVLGCSGVSPVPVSAPVGII